MRYNVVRCQEEIAKKGYQIDEVPIHYRRRSTPTKLSSLRDGFEMDRTLIRKRFGPQ